jgi:hypothetical protein
MGESKSKTSPYKNQKDHVKPIKAKIEDCPKAHRQETPVFREESLAFR